MKKFIILGNSNAALSIIFETLYRIYKTGFEAIIIENIKVEDKLSYKIDGIRITKILHSEWDCGKDIDLNVPIIIGMLRSIIKKNVFDFFKDNYMVNYKNYINLVHPNTELASTVRLYNGITVCPGTVMAPFAEIHNLVSINRNVSIGHHTVIKDFSSIFPGANIAGNCEIGKGVQIGIGANVVDGVSIGDNSVIGAGSLVTRSIPANVTAYGVPAKIIEKG